MGKSTGARPVQTDGSPSHCRSRPAPSRSVDSCAPRGSISALRSVDPRDTHRDCRSATFRPLLKDGNGGIAGLGFCYSAPSKWKLRDASLNGCAVMRRLDFKLEATALGSSARAARFTTRHNEVLTPTFMPVGTHAAVRSQRREDLLESGAQVLLANTYHLLLRPGIEMFEKFGGIHGFMNWPRSVLTDSGGFQIFSLPGSRTMREEYAEFKSYVDRTTIHLSPER